MKRKRFPEVQHIDIIKVDNASNKEASIFIFNLYYVFFAVLILKDTQQNYMCLNMFMLLCLDRISPE